jgi:arylsulfatase A-like enzyme
MVEQLDQAVGRLLDELEAQGVREDTVVVFFSDNGGMDWPAPEDGRMQITSNAPLRNGKASIYEGGTRVPLVVSWPGEVEAGAETDELVSSVDFYPTLLDLLGLAPLPDQHVDGESFAPVLAGEAGGRDAVFCHFPHDVSVYPGESPAASMRRGDWKLVRFFHDGPDFDHRYELYDLSADIGEEQNLAHAYPDRVEELDALLEEYLADTGAARPRPNPDFDPAAVEE